MLRAQRADQEVAPAKAERRGSRHGGSLSLLQRRRRRGGAFDSLDRAAQGPLGFGIGAPAVRGEFDVAPQDGEPIRRFVDADAEGLAGRRRAGPQGRVRLDRAVQRFAIVRAMVHRTDSLAGRAVEAPRMPDTLPAARPSKVACLPIRAVSSATVAPNGKRLPLFRQHSQLQETQGLGSADPVLFASRRANLERDR